MMGMDSTESPTDDIPGTLSGSLRDARLTRGLSQEQLARKLGLRQRQISDLERAAMDPRLSTIRNVAGALDLEVMLVPRHLITAVLSLSRPGAGASSNPMYALGPDDSDLEHGDSSREEVGARRSPRRPVERPPRHRKGRR